MASRRPALSDTGRESAINSGRVMVAGAIVLLAFATLGWRYYSLQIVEYQQFLVQSERNRVRLEAVPPKRGLIYDRKGRLLASNEPSHRLSIVVERVEDLEGLFAQLKELVAISEDDISRFEQRRRRRRPYDPVPLKLQLSDDDMAVVAGNRHQLTGR